MPGRCNCSVSGSNNKEIKGIRFLFFLFGVGGMEVLRNVKGCGVKNERNREYNDLVEWILFERV